MHDPSRDRMAVRPVVAVLDVLARPFDSTIGTVPADYVAVWTSTVTDRA
jgi:hypothetical protein